MILFLSIYFFHCLTTANVVAIFDALYKAIPATVVAKDDMTIWCGQDVFRTYTIALKNANMFNYAFDGKADSEFFLPGTPIKVVATPGLNGVNKIYAIRLSNTARKPSPSPLSLRIGLDP